MQTHNNRMLSPLRRWDESPAAVCLQFRPKSGRYRRGLMLVVGILISLFFLVSCVNETVSLDLEQYYPPTVHSNAEFRSISIPVEILDKDGKRSFIHLFEAYGFSGNGPSIEQVILFNVGRNAGELDSEGNAFYLYASDAESYHELLTDIQCVEKIICLNKWLINASSIIIKE